jgi:hypothetical protein
MQTLTVGLGERSYPIHIGSGLLASDVIGGTGITFNAGPLATSLLTVTTNNASVRLNGAVTLNSDLTLDTGGDPGTLEMAPADAAPIRNLPTVLPRVVATEQLLQLVVAPAAPDSAVARSSDDDGMISDDAVWARWSNDDELVEIIRAIISMASGLFMDVIAEGVETADQAAQLSELACEFGQGFYFHRPLTPERAKTVLAALFSAAAAK